MQIDSTRFGVVEVREEATLVFPDGLPGLPGERWALLAKSEESPFYWLHSMERADLALPVTNPWLFFGDYDVRVPDEDARRLGLASADDALILCVDQGSDHRSVVTIRLAVQLVIHKSAVAGREIVSAAGRLADSHPPPVQHR